MAKKRKVVYFEPDTLDEAQAMLDNGSTKKAVCEFLGIAYNTTRLAKFLEDHEAKKAADKELRKKKRKTACTKEELVAIIEDYLAGASLSELSDNYYRSTTYIRHKLDMAGALIRNGAAKNPLNAPIFPEEGLNLDADFVERIQKPFEEKNRKDWESTVELVKADSEWNKAREILGSGSKFPKNQALRLDGELVWVPGYQCIGEVIKEVPSKEDKAYRVLLLDPHQQKNVHIPYWDLCSLRHLTKLGVNVARMGSYFKNDEVTQLLNEALKAAKKAK